MKTCQGLPASTLVSIDSVTELLGFNLPPRPALWTSRERRHLAEVCFPSVDAPFHARENVGVVVARGRMLSSVRPSMRQEDSRRPVWEFADRVQITRSVLEAQWKALVVPAPSRRLLRHTLLPLALTSSRSWSAYAAATGAL